MQNSTAKAFSDSLDEVYFGYDELFFSRTDLKGLIKSGNSVFKRISGYSWAELENRPHNIIRHADMPKAVFHLLWQMLKSNLPIAAYVKNRAKDGRYYWVFALAMPVKDGYLSVRLKPSSKFFAIIQAEYNNLRSLELRTKLSPEDSLKLLLDRINELGFANYESFMTEALLDEIDSRREKINGAVWPPAPLLKKIRELGKAVKVETEKVLVAYKQNQYVPMNLEIQSARSEGEIKDTMGVVASQYQKMVNEINNEIGNFGNSIDKVTSQLSQNQFMLCANYFLNLVKQFFQKEIAQEVSLESQNEVQVIDSLIEFYDHQVRVYTNEVMNALLDFESTCKKIQTSSVGLEIVRLTGKIEAARGAGAESSDFTGLLNQLSDFRQALTGSFKDIDIFLKEIRSSSKSLSREA